ncbi:unnamed protein product [Lampetra fluviatilis]
MHARHVMLSMCGAVDQCAVAKSGWGWRVTLIRRLAAEEERRELWNGGKFSATTRCKLPPPPPPPHLVVGAALNGHQPRRKRERTRSRPPGPEGATLKR